jgi:hypothetical protein
MIHAASGNVARPRPFNKKKLYPWSSSMQHPVRYVVALCLLVVAGAAPVHAQPPYPWPAHSVVPVFFVPKDWDVNSSEVQAEAAALRSARAEVRQFYAHGLGGNTFVLNDLIVVQANGFKESYGIHWNGGNIYTDGISLDPELESRLATELHDRGFPIYGDLYYHNEGGYVVVIFLKGAGGMARGNGFGYYDDGGGRAILGDWAIDSLQGQVPEGDYWWSGRRIQLGAVAHELGHGFGLIHPDEWGGPKEGVIMWSFWDYPNVGFADYDNNWLNQQRTQYFTQCLPTDPLDPPPAVKPYELVMLPTLGSDTWALHINERGWITGTSEVSTSTPHQALFDPDLNIFDLGTPAAPWPRPFQ